MTLQAADANLLIGDPLGDPMHKSWRGRVDGHRFAEYERHGVSAWKHGQRGSY